MVENVYVNYKFETS